MTEHKSEVARLRQQIAEEYEAAQRGLTGPAIVSRHDFITARMEGIARASAELRQLVGEAEAMQIIIEVNKNVVVEQPQEHSNHRCKEDAMEHEEHAALLSFEATTDEYSAIHHVIDCYIFYLEAALPPSADRRLIIAALHSLRLRPREQHGNTVSWQCSHAEALAFAGAAMCYSRLITMAMPYSIGEAETKRLVIGFQKRYLDSLKS